MGPGAIPAGLKRRWDESPGRDFTPLPGRSEAGSLADAKTRCIRGSRQAGTYPLTSLRQGWKKKKEPDLAASFFLRFCANRCQRAGVNGIRGVLRAIATRKTHL